MEAELTRGSGILLAISSLPSEYGIGTLGSAAYRFVDLLVDLKQKYWQVLPIGPTGFGDSPYQAMSAFAGNPYLIDLDLLAGDGLITFDEIRSFDWGENSDKVDYSLVYENRYKILRKAFERFDVKSKDFNVFIKENEDWLFDYSLFMAIKYNENGKSWLEWDENTRKKEPNSIANRRKVLYNDKVFWEFCQYEFFKQWQLLRKYARTKGIELIGDVAFYLSSDSVDVWARPELFRLREDGEPEYLAAAIPDKYSKTGQVWGSPIYNWEAMEADGFAWWKSRMRVAKELFDVIRFDHFLGVVKNYAVDNDGLEKTGRWFKGPGKKLVSALNEVLDGTKVIADDYGGKALIPGAKKLLNKSGWLGTKVMMFAFDGDTTNEYLPHNYTNHQTAVYIGTQDSETIVGYFRDKNEYELAYLYEYLNIHKVDEISDALIRLAYQCTADVTIIQMQDLLRLGNEARMNKPSTTGDNWRWRLDAKPMGDERRAWIRNLAAVYRR